MRQVQINRISLYTSLPFILNWEAAFSKIEIGNLIHHFGVGLPGFYLSVCTLMRHFILLYLFSFVCWRLSLLSSRSFECVLARLTGRSEQQDYSFLNFLHTDADTHSQRYIQKRKSDSLFLTMFLFSILFHFARIFKSFINERICFSIENFVGTVCTFCTTTKEPPNNVEHSLFPARDDEWLKYSILFRYIFW